MKAIVTRMKKIRAGTPNSGARTHSRAPRVQCETQTKICASKQGQLARQLSAALARYTSTETAGL